MSRRKLLYQTDGAKLTLLPKKHCFFPLGTGTQGVVSSLHFVRHMTGTGALFAHRPRSLFAARNREWVRRRLAAATTHPRVPDPSLRLQNPSPRSRRFGGVNALETDLCRRDYKSNPEYESQIACPAGKDVFQY